MGGEGLVTQNLIFSSAALRRFCASLAWLGWVGFCCCGLYPVYGYVCCCCCCNSCSADFGIMPIPNIPIAVVISTTHPWNTLYHLCVAWIGCAVCTYVYLRCTVIKRVTRERERYEHSFLYSYILKWNLGLYYKIPAEDNCSSSSNSDLYWTKMIFKRPVEVFPNHKKFTWSSVVHLLKTNTRFSAFLTLFPQGDL